MTGNQGKKFSVLAVVYLILPVVIFFVWIDFSTKGPAYAGASAKTKIADMPTPGLKINVTNTPFPEYKSIDAKNEQEIAKNMTYEEKVLGTQSIKKTEVSSEKKEQQNEEENNNKEDTREPTKETRPTYTRTSYPTNKPTNNVVYYTSVVQVVVVTREVTRIVVPKNTQTMTATITPQLILFPTITKTKFYINPEQLKYKLFIPLINK